MYAHAHPADSPAHVSSATKYGFSTVAVHAGQFPDPTTGAVIPPISLSTTFQQLDIGVHAGYEYSRSGNPTRTAFEQAVAALEQGKYGLAFASGSATTATVLRTLAKGGEHAISISEVYGGTYRFFTKVAAGMGVDVTFVDLAEASSLEKHIRPNTRFVWLETPTNPSLTIVDIAAISEIARKNKLFTVVDNTFLSPYFQRPLALGADVVVHSGTKYLNGHADVVIGVAVTNDDNIYKDLTFMQNAIGAIPSPFDCFLANRGLKTLGLRMAAHQRNATAVAKYLEGNPRVVQVIYPGLKSHKQHELAARQQSGFGGMVTFRILKDSQEYARKFLNSCKIFVLAESLGGIESLCELPSLMTHASVDEADRLKLGITDGLIRLSCGIEDADDLVKDVEQALLAAIPTLN